MDEKRLIWGCCTQFSENDNYACCSACGKVYHPACLPNTIFSDNSDWVCPDCVPKSSRKDSTPVGSMQRRNITLRSKKRTDSPSELVDTPIVNTILYKETSLEPPITSNEVRNIMKEVMREELGTIASKIKLEISSVISSELKLLKEEFGDMKESMNFISDQFDDIRRTREADRELVRNLQEQNLKLESLVNDQNSRINQLEQQARSCNLEIQCVPERREENISQIISKISTAIGFSLDEREIQNCTRIAKLNKASTRPRSIVIQFSSPKTRDHFLAAAITFNKSKSNINEKLHSGHIGFREISPIFIMDHLSPANKALHAATRLKAKEKGYRVWIRNGKIFARKGFQGDFIYVRDYDSLKKII